MNSAIEEHAVSNKSCVVCSTCKSLSDAITGTASEGFLPNGRLMHHMIASDGSKWVTVQSDTLDFVSKTRSRSEYVLCENCYRKQFNQPKA